MTAACPTSMPTDLFVTLDRLHVMCVLNADADGDGNQDNPTTAQLELFGDATTGLNMFIDGITESGSTMDIGMFGTDDFYYFYMEFQPKKTTDWTQSGNYF